MDLYIFYLLVYNLVYLVAHILLALATVYPIGIPKLLSYLTTFLFSGPIRHFRIVL